MNFENFKEVSPGCFILDRYVDSFKVLGLGSVDDFVSFSGGQKITTKVVASFRNRVCFTAGEPAKTFYLKTYDHPPLKVQLSNWLDHGRRLSTAAYDYTPAMELDKIGIKTPVVAAYGEVMGAMLEKKSFIVTEEISDGVSLERYVPEFFTPPITGQKRKEQLDFIAGFADFTGKFHFSGFRHRDYYLAHIFWAEQSGFQMIDLQRVFKPKLLAWKFRVKDIAQLYYSAPGSIYSKAMRLRFYKRYAGVDKLTSKDRLFIKCVKGKAAKMAAHDEKKGKRVPYKS